MTTYFFLNRLKFYKQPIPKLIGRINNSHIFIELSMTSFLFFTLFR